MRRLTHTLHLPPAQTEIYDGPRPDWLRDILEQLPNLQSLFVSQLPFFDHQALQTLRFHSEIREQAARNSFPVYALRLMVATQCPNATSTSLSEALTHLPNMVFLDLSKTMAARDPFVLSKLGHMPSLQVLKLRGIGLRDEDLEIIAAAVKLRVRSLDVRGNALTDRSTKILLRWCFKAIPEEHGLLEATPQPGLVFRLEDWPSGITRPDPQLLDDLRSEALDKHFMKQLATPTANRLPSEDWPNSGITHLYISNNHLTIDGLTALVESRRLFVLDIGAAYRLQLAGRARSSSSSQAMSKVKEKLIRSLEKNCFRNLTSLRIHYDMLAETMSPTGSHLPPVPVGVTYEGARFELDDALVLTASGLVSTAQAVTDPNALQRQAALRVDDVEPTDRPESLSLRAALIERQRIEFRQGLRDKPQGLLPGMLPRLRTLVLTDIPCRDFTNEVVQSLTRFIGYCAMEAEFARLQADETGNAQSGLPQIGNSAPDSFALSQIVLEMGPPGSSNLINYSKSTSRSINFPYRTKSSTEDADSEALWSAQENDFSFFGDEEECGLPVQESAIDMLHPAALSEKQVVVPGEMHLVEPAFQPVKKTSDQGIDVVRELAKFRRERKMAYEEALKQGKRFVEGYWPGEVKVVRWLVQKEGVEFYGNYSEKGTYR